ncbi:hypothetical protein HDU96_006531 [Phlyctochytrium bullatum]|nr:hypothetical protein HDU96_006531 [Phlyctochytrium bullatum]
MLLPFRENYKDVKDRIDTTLEGEEFFLHLHKLMDCGAEARWNNLRCAVYHGMPELTTFLVQEMEENRPFVIANWLGLAISQRHPGVVTALLSHCSAEMLDELNCTNIFLEQSLDACSGSSSEFHEKQKPALRAFVDHDGARKRLDVESIIFNQLNPAALTVFVEFANDPPESDFFDPAADDNELGSYAHELE